MQFQSLVLVLEKTSPPELCRAEEFSALELCRFWSVCFLEKYGLANSTIASFYMPTSRRVRLANALRALNVSKRLIKTSLSRIFLVCSATKEPRKKFAKAWQRKWQMFSFASWMEKKLTSLLLQLSHHCPLSHQSTVEPPVHQILWPHQ